MKKGDITTGYFKDEKVVLSGDEHIRFYFDNNNSYELYLKDNILRLKIFDGALHIRPIASNYIEIKPTR